MLKTSSYSAKVSTLHGAAPHGACPFGNQVSAEVVSYNEVMLGETGHYMPRLRPDGKAARRHHSGGWGGGVWRSQARMEAEVGAMQPQPSDTRESRQPGKAASQARRASP